MRSKSYVLRGDRNSTSPVLLIPDPSATLFIIDSIDDFDTLAKQYPQRYANPKNPTVRPNWATLPGFVDAVHVTASAVTDEDNPYVHAWECESTLWFRGDSLIRCT
jgi:hypothetical protein